MVSHADSFCIPLYTPMKATNFHGFRARVFCTLLAAALNLFWPSAGKSAEPQVLKGHITEASTHLTPMGRLDSNKRLRLAIGLPPRDPAKLDQLVKELYDPANPNFRKFLTPAQFTERFGSTAADFQAVANFANAHHLNVTEIHANRLVVDVEAAVADIESALHVRLRTYRHPTEARQFYAPDVEPSLDLAVPVSHISGLDDYALPHPNLAIRPAALAAQASPNAASGPGGTYGGGDFRAAYLPGVLATGAGQSVGLLQFDGFYPSDIVAYRNKFGLPNIPIVVTSIDGGVTIPGNDNIEVSLDIEMAMSMAPGLAAIYVYEAPKGSLWVDLLSRMANDNLAQQLSCSWAGGAPNSTAEVIFKQMAAQGQSFFAASGDSDAYTGFIPFPCDSPDITIVGGTTLSTGGPSGSYVSETVWNWGSAEGSSGGSSITYPIPTWQQSLNMTANLGSPNWRNIPDVAFTADNVYLTYNNGSATTVGGTSCAAPLWAGFTALVNQAAAANSLPPIGFLNPTLYGQSQNFHDITTGNNFSPSSPAKFPAVAGYDLCTGLGTPGSALLSSLAPPLPGADAAPTNLTYSASPAVYAMSAPITPNIPSNLGGIILSYSVSPALPAGLVLNPATGAIYGTPTATAAAANYTVTGSNNASSTTATLNLAVSVVAPSALAYSANPATYQQGVVIRNNTPTSAGSPVVSYSVSPALPMGLNLNSTTGVISGAATTTVSGKNYTITAANTAGSCTTVLNLAVLASSAIPDLFVVTVYQGIGSVREYNSLTGATINSSFASGLYYPYGGVVVGNNFFVTQDNGIVAKYNATSGAVINSNFITASAGSFGIAAFGNNLFIANSFGTTVSEYNGVTGAAVNTSFISGLNKPSNLAVAGNKLFISCDQANTLGVYDATTGATINANFISGLSSPEGVAILNNVLYVVSFSKNSIGEYDASTGAAINTNFITGLAGPYGISITGNSLFVSNRTNGTVGEYDATTGAAINSNFVSNLGNPAALAIFLPVTAAPSALTYSPNPAIYPLGLPITANVPASSGGPVASYSISPALPSGLTLNPDTGIITGTPTTPAPLTTYTVTATNSVGSTTAILSLAVNVVRPSSLTYSAPSAAYTLGIPISNNIPTYVGSPVLSYSVSPALPAGLSLNPATGIISGTPVAAAPTATYTVTATNTAGSTATSLNLAVVDVAPSSISYLYTPYVLEVGVATSNPPTSAGSPILSYSITPPLPTGLSLNSSTGVISGTPTAVYPATDYTITGTNDAGSSSTTLNISVTLTGAGQLFVGRASGIIGKYDATTGSVINAAFISGLSGASPLAIAGNILYVGNGSNQTVGEYSALTGAVINPNFITGTSSLALMISNNQLFVDTGSVIRQYNAATGALINANFISGPKGQINGLALSGNGIYLIDGDFNLVGKYDATTGAAINASFVTGLDVPYGITASGNNLYVANALSNVVGKYDATTGAALNTNFIPGLNYPRAPLIFNNCLLVANYYGNSIGEYSAVTGAAINSSFIAGVSSPLSIAFLPTVTSAPSDLAYATPAVYTFGLPISANFPTSSGGAVVTYSVSPPLPPGLVLNSTTGVISGVPTAVSPAGDYIVTATNSVGSTTAAVNISVKDAPPNSLTYTANPATYALGTTIFNNVPSNAGGLALSYTVSPPLPAGLTLNGATGVISGIPTTISPAANYIVTAANGAGSTSVALNIAINLGVTGSQLFVARGSNFTSISSYNAATGALINSNLISGLASPSDLAILGNHLFVANGNGTNVGEYDAISGAPINASFITGLSSPVGVAVSGNNIFVTSEGASKVGEFDATTGAAINPNLFTGLSEPGSLAISGDNLFIVELVNGTVSEHNVVSGALINSNIATASGRVSYEAILGGNLYLTTSSRAVGEYNASTGALINANFITNLPQASAIAALGNTLYVMNSGTSVGTYNAATGATINANFITGLYAPDGLAVLPQPVVPSALTYSATSAVYTLGLAIPSNTPSVAGGAPTAYSIAPALPAGLVLNPTTGVISGVPTALAAAGSYTVTAANPAGNTTASLNITVNDAAPSALVYSANPAIYTTGIAIAGNTPASNGGAVVSYSVNPPLPNGLSLNATSGAITGTPMTPAAMATYAVTGSNTGGSTTASLAITVLSPMQAWRQLYFGTTLATGTAADTADPYHTGVPNLLVFAFFGPNQDPALASATQLPQLQISGNDFYYSFTQPVGVSGLVYGAEWSADLAAGSWHAITDTGSGSVHTFIAPIGSNTRMYIRLTATVPGP